MEKIQIWAQFISMQTILEQHFVSERSFRKKTAPESFQGCYGRSINLVFGAIARTFALEYPQEFFAARLFIALVPFSFFILFTK